MPIDSQEKTIEKNGERKDILELTFSNEAFKQLNMLREHFKLNDMSEVVKLGISFLERMKNRETEKAASEKMVYEQ